MRVTVRIRCTARCVRLPRRHLSNRSSSRYAAVQVFAAHLCVVSRDAVEVTSSFGRAWDAVIDVFAEANKPIRTMERASGFIAAELATIPVYTSAQRTFAHSLADCGYRGRLSTYRRRRSTTSWYGVTARTLRFKAHRPVSVAKRRDDDRACHGNGDDGGLLDPRRAREHAGIGDQGACGTRSASRDRRDRCTHGNPAIVDAFYRT